MKYGWYKVIDNLSNFEIIDKDFTGSINATVKTIDEPLVVKITDVSNEEYQFVQKLEIKSGGKSLLIVNYEDEGSEIERIGDMNLDFVRVYNDESLEPYVPDFKDFTDFTSLDDEWMSEQF